MPFLLIFLHPSRLCCRALLPVSLLQVAAPCCVFRFCVGPCFYCACSSSTRMFSVRYSAMHLLETVASRCRLSYHSYLREVGGDGSVLGGVELELAVFQEGAATTRFFFWSCVPTGSECSFEEPALQAVRFLQGVYGFVLRDFNYEGMIAYRSLARSAVVLAVSFARSFGPASRPDVVGSVGTESSQWQTLCNQLIASVCDM